MAPLLIKDGDTNPSGQTEKNKIVGIAENTMQTGLMPVKY
jgi:hypothetical protein